MKIIDFLFNLFKHLLLRVTVILAEYLPRHIKHDKADGYRDQADSKHNAQRDLAGEAVQVAF